MTKGRIVLIIAAILILILIIVGGFLFLKQDIPQTASASTVQVVEKLRAAEKQGGTVELTEAEINSIIDLYTGKNSIPHIDELYVSPGDGMVEMYVTSSLKANVMMQIYSRGELTLSEGNVIFTPQVLKVGRIPLPKGLFLNQLRNPERKGVTVTDDSIIFEKILFPLEITTLTISEGKVIIGIKKTGDQAAGQSDNNISNNSNNGIDDNIGSSNSSNSNDSNNSSNEEVEQEQATDTEKNALLQQVESQLGVVYGKVKTSDEKAIVGTMRSTVNSLSQDPGYPYKEKAAGVLSQYKELTPEEKNDLKLVMLTNMDINTALEVKNLFGL